MSSIRKTFFVIMLLVIGVCAIFTHEHLTIQVHAETVKEEIDKKNQELAEIQKKILENQAQLEQAQNQKQTAASEVQRVTNNIKQVDLGIKQSEVVIEKLEYEIEDLKDNIVVAENDLSIKAQAVGELFRQLQIYDQDNFLISFLRSKNLSEGLSMAQGLMDTNEALLVKITELQESHTILQSVLGDAQNKKTNKEIENENLKNKKLIAAELKAEKEKALQDAKKKESTYQESLKELEERQAEIAAEIDAMEAQLRTQIDYDGLPTSGSSVLVLPVANPRITQEHGNTSSAKKLYKSQYHNGMDFGVPVGTMIIAAYDGVVVSVANQDAYCKKGAYGKYVAIKHSGIGLATLYAHLSLYTVKEGDQVKKGQLIGYSGNTGYSTGPHLHFGVYDLSTFRIAGSKSCGPEMPFGGDLNPRNYLSL